MLVRVYRHVRFFNNVVCVCPVSSFLLSHSCVQFYIVTMKNPTTCFAVYRFIIRGRVKKRIYLLKKERMVCSLNIGAPNLTKGPVQDLIVCTSSFAASIGLAPFLDNAKFCPGNSFYEWLPSLGAR